MLIPGFFDAFKEFDGLFSLVVQEGTNRSPDFPCSC